MDQGGLTSFLIEAKLRTYAAQGDEASVMPVLSGSKQLEFQAGDFLYRDIYFGFGFFVGQEIVEFQGHPVWSMVYAGGMSDADGAVALTHDVYNVLRQALRLVDETCLYRGPVAYDIGALAYRNSATGGFDNFSGREEIAHNCTLVYALNYSGGLIR